MRFSLPDVSLATHGGAGVNTGEAMTRGDDDIFGEALDLPPAERASFVARECGNDTARQARIAALLSAIDGAGGFLENPIVGRDSFHGDEPPGTAIGRYTLIKKVGEGGCGAVYLAEQRVPVRRRVALKVIKLGMDTRQVIARFESERQALAMMDHPDIARVLDAEATDAGRPYFVMDFVDGVPITRFCDEHRLGLRARLELFVRVCLALQHAHQKGLIHRDVKPSNILVAERDGVPAPKVIDFGIAKATRERLTEQTLLTGVDQVIGTPAYMSPEQADQRDGDIDTRSDVYSLGVLLYELLAGRLPFDPDTLRHAGVERIRRLICEMEPSRPSVRFDALAAAERETIARARATTAAGLQAELRDDLDWIAMRCIEKDRDRRYGSAQALADDVRRHLAQEPVEARPPSTAYRARRFVARHRVVCAAAAAVLVTMIVGTVVSVAEAVRATRAEHLARAERDAANVASRVATQAKADAQRRQEQAEDLLTFMLGNFRAELKNTRIEVLDAVDNKAMEYFASLEHRDLTDTVLARQAKALYQIGETRTDEARFVDAATAFAGSYERAAALTARHPKDPDMLFERAQAEYWIGYVALHRGDLTTAGDWWTRYRDSALALLALEGPKLRAQHEVAYGHHNLAALDFIRGDLVRAAEGFERERAAIAPMLAAYPNDGSLRYSMGDAASWLGSVAEADGRYEAAFAYYAEYLAAMEDLVRREPRIPKWRRQMGEGIAMIAHLHAVTGHREEARAGWVRANEVRQALYAADPQNRLWQEVALRARLHALELKFASGDYSDAAAELVRAREQLEAIVKADRTAKQFTLPLLLALRLEAQLKFALHQTGAAEAASRAQQLGDPFVVNAGVENGMLGEYARACVIGARIAFADGRTEDGRRQCEQALRVLAPRLARSNDWALLDPGAQALLLLSRGDEAQPLIERLRRFGYHSLDPIAAPLFATVPFPSSN